MTKEQTKQAIKEVIREKFGDIIYYAIQGGLLGAGVLAVSGLAITLEGAILGIEFWNPNLSGTPIPLLIASIGFVPGAVIGALYGLLKGD